MGTNPSFYQRCGKDCPVERVSWYDVQDFLNKLNQIEGTDLYRLPTESEWEYACRAGSTTSYCFGNNFHYLRDYAWFGKVWRGTLPVGQLKPNAWGLYDMHGNIAEWCRDWYGKYPTEAVVNPAGLVSGQHRVLRGGSWASDSKSIRSATRQHFAPDVRYRGIGFRVAKAL
jgi:formylglycine-generating enzyme required for sulfatase activity